MQTIDTVHSLRFFYIQCLSVCISFPLPLNQLSLKSSLHLKLFQDSIPSFRQRILFPFWLDLLPLSSVPTSALTQLSLHITSLLAVTSPPPPFFLPHCFPHSSLPPSILNPFSWPGRHKSSLCILESLAEPFHRNLWPGTSKHNRQPLEDA